MLAQFLTWLSAHGLVFVLAAFSFISTLLAAVAALLSALGRAVPGWIGSAISFCASIMHFLNGNLQAATAAAPKEAKIEQIK